MTTKLRTFEKRINKYISKYNNSPRYGAKPTWIVVHWVGAVSTAKNNCLYFAGGNRNASAHFFVDDKYIWQSVECDNASWHCGGGLQSNEGHKYFGSCKNSNSIGIEMCCKKKNGKLYISDKTISNTEELVKYLMKKYNIPANHVIRHYDVTGKFCPGNYISSKSWNSLHKTLTGSSYKRVAKVKYGGVLPSETVNKNTGSKKDIKRWQSFLCWFGTDVEMDGSFGPDTEEKTKIFQGATGLNRDGSVGPKTLKAAKKYKK